MPLRRHSQRLASLTLALLLAVATAGCAFPEEASDGSIDGTYYINGFDHRGNEYGGSLTITSTPEDDVFEMQWIITGAIQAGVGTVTGSQLDVEWYAVAGFDTTSQGRATYEITPDGELIGERSVDGQDGVATEEAFPIVD